MNCSSFSLRYVLAGLLMLITLNVSAQKKEHVYLDSLLKQLPVAKNDTNNVNLFIKLAEAYSDLKQNNSAGQYFTKSLQLSQKLNWQKGIARTNFKWGVHYYHQDDYVQSQKYTSKAAELAFSTGDYPFAFDAAGFLAGVIYKIKKEPAAISYLLTSAERFKKYKRTKELTGTYVLIGDYNQDQFNFSAAMEYFDKALQLEESSHSNYLKGYQLNQIAYFFNILHQNQKAKGLFFKALKLDEQAHDLEGVTDDYVGLSECTREENNNAGTALYFRKALETAQKTNDANLLCRTENEAAWDSYLIKDYEQAYIHAKKAVSYVKASPREMMYSLSTLGSIYRDAPESVIKKAGLKPGQQYQKALDIILKANDYGKAHGDHNMISYGMQEASLTYEKMHRYEDAFKAYKAYIADKDSTDKLKNEKAVLLKQAQLGYTHKEDSLNFTQSITNAQLKQKKQQSYFFMAGIAALVLLSVFIWLNFNNQRKSNTLLAETNGQLSDALATLKAAQQQLIQSEKMASLGELTAGIAHEIQNPLNFVNNFSEVNTELIEEMQTEIDKGDLEEVKAIANDIKENQQKISQHGKRADFIVKGMLQHSRSGTGERQPTNINLLADEFLKLSYHGLRAKDKNFSADLITNFDETLPKINASQQDIGRVLLNLFNNAFYAVNEKKKTAGATYKPEVTVTTVAGKGEITVKVSDNGNGIPPAIKDKIMQPFFTTKPAGQGTGLGLSLSYDIVVKGHGGTIDMESAAGEGSVFIIKIPVS